MQKPRIVKQKVCARPKVKGCKIQQFLGRKPVQGPTSASKQFETHDIHVLFMHALDDTCIAGNMYKACRQQPEGCHQMTAYHDMISHDIIIGSHLMTTFRLLPASFVHVSCNATITLCMQFKAGNSCLHLFIERRLRHWYKLHLSDDSGAGKHHKVTSL